MLGLMLRPTPVLMILVEHLNRFRLRLFSLGTYMILVEHPNRTRAIKGASWQSPSLLFDPFVLLHQWASPRSLVLRQLDPKTLLLILLMNISRLRFYCTEYSARDC